MLRERHSPVGWEIGVPVLLTPGPGDLVHPSGKCVPPLPIYARRDGNDHRRNAWANLCGTAPIPASLGKTRRHRLNRGGDRQANSALYHIVITRMRHDQDTRDYIARRLTEGKTMGEIARILKRYAAREVFKHLPRPV